MTRPEPREALLVEARDSETLPPDEATLAPESAPDESTLPPDESTLPPDDDPDESTLPPDDDPDAPALPASAAPWSARELLGHKLGAWKILALLGEGGWGAVFRAQRSGDGRLAAIKVPKLRDPGTRRERLARFRREIECLQRIHADGQATHVVGFLEADPESQPPWLALELVDGLDLAHELGRLRKLPLARILELGLEIVAGLAEAHRAGVIHRDLKPGNVLLAADGQVRLADFGVARTVRGEGETDADDGLTVTGQQLGTLHYMSPEAISGEQVGPPADFYSLGVLLFHAVAGRPPFRGSQAALFHAHLFQDPPRLREFEADVPAEFEDLVVALLAKTPMARPGVEEVEKWLTVLRDRTSAPQPREARPSVALELEPDEVVRDDASGQSYTVVRELGRGGMGIVYEVRDEAGTRLALKVAGFAFSTAEEARAQLVRDAGNALRVSLEHPHPGVARVHLVGEGTFRGAPLVFVVSELVEGPSLRQVLRERGTLDDDLTRDLFLGVAEGLAAVHRAGVLHLDLTPGNVLLALDPEQPGLHQATPKLVDFGISKAVDAQTLRGIEGNPRYMSPEQCDGERPSPASDIYMFGATCYHAATGRPPFSGEPVAVMHKHRRGLPPHADLESPLGHDLALVIHRCLFKDPTDRYPTADALLEDLRRVGTSSFPRAALRKSWKSEQKRLTLRPGRKLIWALVILAFVLGGGAGWLQVKRSDDQVRFLEQQIGRAGAADLARLGSEVAALDHYGDDNVQTELLHRLAGRTAELRAELVSAMKAEVLELRSRPTVVKDTLEKLRSGRLGDLRALQTSPKLRTLIRELSPDHADRLVSLDQELAALISLAQVAELDRQPRAVLASWDELARRLREIPDPPMYGQPVRDELERQVKADLEAMRAALARAEANAKQRLEQGLAGQAKVQLEGFERDYPSYVRHAETLRDLTAARAAVDAAAQVSDEDRQAEELFNNECRSDYELLVELSAQNSLAPEQRSAFRRSMRRLDTFLAQDLGGTPVHETKPGHAIDAAVEAARRSYAIWAAAAWAEVASQEPGESADAFRDHGQRLADFDPDWFDYYQDSDPVPAPGHEGLSLRQLHARAQQELVRAEREAFTAWLTAAEAAVLDVSGRSRAQRIRQARDAAERAKTFRHPEHDRLELVERQLETLEAITAEGVWIELEPGSLVGAGKESGTNPNFERPAEDLPPGLFVSRCETPVAHYAVFLEVVRTLGPRHRDVLGCPREEGGTQHAPRGWTDDAEPMLPVEGLSWYDADAFARWAGAELPRRDVWEVVARGTSRAVDRLEAWVQQFEAEGHGLVQVRRPVDSARQPGGTGALIFNMGGNVSEWTNTHAKGYPNRYYCSGPNYRDLEDDLEDAGSYALYQHAFYKRERQAPGLGVRLVWGKSQ